MPTRPVVRLIVAAASASAVPAASAIVYRNDMTDALAQSLATQYQFNATGKVNNGGGTGTLILPDWVITAKHVTGGDANGTTNGSFSIGGTTYTGKVYANPANDFSLIHLTSGSVPSTAAKPIAPGFFGGEAGKLVWLVGYGGYETVANQADVKYDGKLRAGTNVVREYQAPYLYYDNANTSANSSVYESSTAPGDSGGPMYQQVGNNWYVVGETFGAGAQGFIHTPTNANKAFILNTIRTIKGNASFDFATPAGPTSLLWHANPAVQGYSDGGGTWDAQRPNFWTKATGFTYQWDNALANDVTFGSGAGAAGVVTITTTNVASGTLNAGGAGPAFAAAGAIAHSLTFDSAGTGTYTIAAAGQAALRLDGTAAGDPTITANADAEISAPISSFAGTITKKGNGTLTLSGSNGFGSTFVIAAGTVAAKSPAALPSYATPGRTLISAGAGLTVTAGSGPGRWTASQIDTLRNNLLSTGTGTYTFGFDTPDSTFVYSAPITGPVGLLKTGAGSLYLTGAGTYTGPTTIAAGALNTSGGNNRLPVTTTLNFNGTAGMAFSTFAQTVGGITQSANTTATIASGSLTLANANGATLGGTNATLDLAGLSDFAFSQPGQTLNVNGNNAAVKFAQTTRITGKSLNVGTGDAGGSANTSTAVTLGTKQTVVNVDSLQVGNYHASASVTAPAGSVVTLRGVSGGDSRLPSMTVGLNTAGAQAQSGTFDAAVATLDARVDTLVVGTYQPNTGGSSATGTFVMNAGTLDANAVTVALAKAVGTGSGGVTHGTIDQRGGTVRVGTLTLGQVANATQTNTTVNAVYTLGGASSAATLAAAGIKAGANVAGVSPASTRTINFNDGRLTTLDADTDLTLSGVAGSGQTAASQLRINLAATGTHALTAPVGRTISATNAVSFAGPGGLLIDGPGTVDLSSYGVYSGVTTVAAGTLKASPAMSEPMLYGGGTDVRNGRVVFVRHAAGTNANIAAMLDRGYDTDFAAGKLFSSTATASRGLGYGVSAAGDLTVAAVYYGDADLSGAVDFADFVALQSNFGQSNADFSDGDFDYNGLVNFADFVKLQANFGQTLTGARVEFTREQLAAVAAFGIANAVPEPASLAAFGVAAAGTLRRRRRTVCAPTSGR